MNMWSYLPGANSERADDRVHLIKAVDSDSVGDANVDSRNDDDVDDEEEDEEENVDKSTADNLAGCGRCDRDRLVECEDSKGLDYSSSLDVNEVCVNVEKQVDTKKRKKPLRKTVSYGNISSGFCRCCWGFWGVFACCCCCFVFAEALKCAKYLIEMNPNVYLKGQCSYSW